MANLLQTAKGDVYDVDLNPIIGSEKRGSRPCVVVSEGNNPLGLCIVLPITAYSQGKRNPNLFLPIHKNLNSRAGLAKPSCIDCYQIRCIDKKRLKNKRGTLSAATVDRALDILSIHLAYSP